MQEPDLTENQDLKFVQNLDLVKVCDIFFVEIMKPSSATDPYVSKLVHIRTTIIHVAQD